VHVFLPIFPRVGILLLLLVAAAAIFDIRYRRIPNWLTASGVVLGVALNSIIGRPEAGWAFSLEGLTFGFVVYFVLYALHAMGAGDVKLMAAIGAFTGPVNWFGIFAVSAIIGGVMGLLLAILRKRLKSTVWNMGFIVGEMTRGRAAFVDKPELDVKHPKSLGLPHGAVIAVGTALFMAAGWRFAR